MTNQFHTMAPQRTHKGEMIQKMIGLPTLKLGTLRSSKVGRFLPDYDSYLPIIVMIPMTQSRMLLKLTTVSVTI